MTTFDPPGSRPSDPASLVKSPPYFFHRQYCSKRCSKKDARLGHRHECKRLKNAYEPRPSKDENNNGNRGNGGNSVNNALGDWANLRSSENGGVKLENISLAGTNLDIFPSSILTAPDGE